MGGVDGCDAQPYFRIFNPITQSEKFDADGRFIKRYLPQLAKLPAKWVHAPWLCWRAKNWRRSAWCWAKTTRSRSWITRKQGRGRWPDSASEHTLT